MSRIEPSGEDFGRAVIGLLRAAADLHESAGAVALASAHRRRAEALETGGPQPVTVSARTRTLATFRSEVLARPGSRRPPWIPPSRRPHR